MGMKGIAFSIVILFLVWLFFLIVFTQQAHFFEISKIDTLKNRINSMVILFDSISRDSEKAMVIIAKRAMNAAINKVIEEGKGLTSANKTIVELIVNGTINNDLQPLMENSTLKDWINKMIFLANQKGFFLTIDIINIFIYLNDSFNLAIEYKFKITIKDEKTDSRISKTIEKTAYSSILNLEDPLYPLNTLGRVTNYFRESPHWMNYTNVSKLLDDLNNSYYHISLNGASFLDRLEGKYFVQDKYRVTKNYVGLESFVNKDKILISGLPIRINQTNIDYLYFSNYNTTSYKILGMPDNFRLDNETTVFNKTHLQIYNATIV
ncbi:MAG: hypothetical protein RMJ17_01085 [Candidatus Aenigmarchaeota archaeon]|nr:hypothetical protein [Candidatus Aenigmarchaeota archaeon]MDW8149180.1 hypothetical protein [Candidatus Aenigmarchaeota archaeon]